MRRTFAQDLMDAAERGDRAAFDRIFDRGFEVLYALAFQRVEGDQPRAERLVSELLMRSAGVEPTQPGVEPAPSLPYGVGDQSTNHPRKGAA